MKLKKLYHLDYQIDKSYTITGAQIENLLLAFEKEDGAQFAGTVKAALVNSERLEIRDWKNATRND